MSYSAARKGQRERPREAGRPLHKTLVKVWSSTLLVGSNDFYPEERQVHRGAADGLCANRARKEFAARGGFRRVVRGARW